METDDEDDMAEMLQERRKRKAHARQLRIILFVAGMFLLAFVCVAAVVVAKARTTGEVAVTRKAGRGDDRPQLAEEEARRETAGGRKGDSSGSVTGTANISDTKAINADRKLTAKPKYYVYLNSFVSHFPQYLEAPMTSFQRGQLENEFRNNELLASRMYKGQRFYISGPARDLSVNGDATILTLGYNELDSAICACASRDELLLKIKALGQSDVLLEGTCMGSAYFTDCRVIEVSTK